MGGVTLTCRTYEQECLVTAFKGDAAVTKRGYLLHWQVSRARADARRRLTRPLLTDNFQATLTTPESAQVEPEVTRSRDPHRLLRLNVFHFTEISQRLKLREEVHSKQAKSLGIFHVPLNLRLYIGVRGVAGKGRLS
eukprot:9159982-Pyramimonas_sp.AAC.2